MRISCASSGSIDSWLRDWSLVWLTSLAAVGNSSAFLKLENIPRRDATKREHGGLAALTHLLATGATGLLYQFYVASLGIDGPFTRVSHTNTEQVRSLYGV